jgi:hypothetical protein
MARDILRAEDLSGHFAEDDSIGVFATRENIFGICAMVESQLPNPRLVDYRKTQAETSFNRMMETGQDINGPEADELHDRFAELIGQTRIAEELHYFGQTRLPFLVQEPLLYAALPAVEEMQFQMTRKHGLEHGQSATTFVNNNWFRYVAKVTDATIPEKKIREAAIKYYKLEGDFFGSQNLVAKKRAVDLLKFSLYGQLLLKRPAKTKFADMALYNQARRDRSDSPRPYAVGLCDFTTEYVYVSPQEKNAYTNASVLAHEGAHVDNGAITKGDPSFVSMREAHSIASQLIVASEQIEAGLDPEKVMAPLKNILPQDIVALLYGGPKEFIRRAAAQNGTIQRRWMLTPEQCKIDDDVAEKLAASLPRLKRPLPVLTGKSEKLAA